MPTVEKSIKSHDLSKPIKSINKNVDVSSLKDWLNLLSLTVNPTIHVNGVSHPTAIVVVDFGSPLVPIQLENDQVQVLNNHLKQITRGFYKSDVNVRVSADTNNGVFWSSVA